MRFGREWSSYTVTTLNARRLARHFRLAGLSGHRTVRRFLVQVVFAPVLFHLCLYYFDWFGGWNSDRTEFDYSMSSAFAFVSICVWVVGVWANAAPASSRRIELSFFLGALAGVIASLMLLD